MYEHRFGMQLIIKHEYCNWDSNMYACWLFWMNKFEYIPLSIGDSHRLHSKYTYFQEDFTQKFSHKNFFLKIKCKRNRGILYCKTKYNIELDRVIFLLILYAKGSHSTKEIIFISNLLPVYKYEKYFKIIFFL